MKSLSLSVFILMVFFFAQNLNSQEVDVLSKNYEIVSVPYSVPDNDQGNFADVDFRFAWNGKKPGTIAIQFVNHGYTDRKLKFAIRDVTSKKTIILDSAHKSRFGIEKLKANSKGAVWSGPIDNIKDSFSLRVWNSGGEKFDKEPISIDDQQ